MDYTEIIETLSTFITNSVDEYVLRQMRTKLLCEIDRSEIRNEDTAELHKILASLDNIYYNNNSVA